jgi:PAS domain S-box-containing protein
MNDEERNSAQHNTAAADSAATLRSAAEAALRERTAQSPPSTDALLSESVRKTLHELRVHQIELEMQNDELQRTQAELAASHARYFDLYELAPVGYCTLSDKGLILQINLTATTLLGVARGALLKRTFSHFILNEDNDIFYRLRRQLSEQGMTQTAQLRMKNGDTAFWAQLTVSQMKDADGEPVLRVALSDISARKRDEETIRQSVEQLKAALMSAVGMATTLSEMRDPYTAGHEKRTGELAGAIGAELGWDAQRIEGLRVAGYLHDIGMIMIPPEILSKPTRLSAPERALIQSHPQSSYDVLKDVKFTWPVAQVALQHHERMDGSGYPQGLRGEAILFEARIMAVADVIEAMSSHRPYRAALGLDAALAEIERGRGTVYDTAVVDACLRLFREKGYTLPKSTMAP